MGPDGDSGSDSSSGEALRGDRAPSTKAERGSSRLDESNADAGRSSSRLDGPSEGLSSGHIRPMDAEMGASQPGGSSEAMNQGQGRPTEAEAGALVPTGHTSAGFPEPEGPVPTLEEMYQDEGALDGPYNEGVRSGSDSDNVPPEDFGMWVRREEPMPDRRQGPSSGSDAWAPDGAPETERQRDHARCAWLRISGSPEVMEEFRRELSLREPRATVFEPAVVLEGGSRIHRMSCSLLPPDKGHSHLLCPDCTSEMQSSSDRLVCDNHRTVHSSLACTRLRRTASSKVLSWCNICNFAGLGPASNLREGFTSGYRSSSTSVPTPMGTPEGDMEPMDAAIEAARLESLGEGMEECESECSWTEDEAASDPPSDDCASESGNAPFEI